MPAAVLIDLDDTLLDDRGAMAAAVLLFREQQRFLPSADDRDVIEKWDEIGRLLWRRLALGEVTFQEQRRIRLREVFSLRVEDDEADALFENYLNFYERSWALLPGADEFLNATSHLPRVIVTNGYRPQALRKLEKLGLGRSFNGIVTPDDCGARKPDTRIFVHALGLLRIQAGDALMVGDNFEADIQPAIALGMKVFHVDPLAQGRTIRDATSAA